TDLDFDVQVAARGARGAGLTFAADRQTGTRENARGDADFQGALDADPPASHAGRARIGNDVAAAAAGPACLLHPKKPLVHQHHALAATLPALCGFGPLLAPGPGAFRADLLARDGDRFLDPLGRL